MGALGRGLYFCQGTNPLFLTTNYTQASILSRDSGIRHWLLLIRSGRLLLHEAYDPTARKEVTLRWLAGSDQVNGPALKPLLDYSPGKGWCPPSTASCCWPSSRFCTMMAAGHQSTLLMGRFLTGKCQKQHRF